MQVQCRGEFGTHAVGFRRAEHDCAFVGRQRSGITVDGRDRFAEQFVEHAAAADGTSGDLQDGGAEHAPCADLVDNQLQRLRLIDRGHRSGATREHACEARRTNRFRADEAPLCDGDRRFGNRYDVPRTRQTGQRFAQNGGEIVALHDQARAHRNRNDTVGQRCFVNRGRNHADNPATICSMRYIREPFRSTTSSGRPCSRSHAIASSFV